MAQKNPKCKCDICWAYSVGGRPKRRCPRGYDRWSGQDWLRVEKGTITGNCELCLNQRVLLGYPVHISITQFLGRSPLCWQCKNLANHFILQKHGLCYFKSTSQEIELALLDMLTYCLVGEIKLASNSKFNTNIFWAIRHSRGMNNAPEADSSHEIIIADWQDVPTQETVEIWD